MIIDIKIPVITAMIMPFLWGNDCVGVFPSTLRYQYAGNNKIQILQAIKKDWEVNWSWLYPKVNKIDIVGMNDTNNSGNIAFFASLIYSA